MSDAPNTLGDSSIDGESEGLERGSRFADGEDANLEIANPEDYELKRDEDGDLLPVTQRIPGTDLGVKVKPLTPGAFEEWGGVLDGSDTSSERQAELFRERVVEPERWATADVEYLEETMDPAMVGGVLKAIRNTVAYEVFRATREEEMQDAAAMMRHMDREELNRFADLGQQLDNQ